MGRPRSKQRSKWPDYLYLKRTEPDPYYVWRHPQTGEEFGLGGDFKKACLEAMEANLKIASLLGNRRLVDRIDASGKGTVREWIVEFRTLLAERKLAANTIKTNNWKLRKIEETLGDKMMERVTTKDLSDFLDQWIKKDQKRSAVSIRSMLDDMFRAAAGKGWVKENPVAALMKISAKVKRTRLSLEEFLKIHQTAAASDRWTQRMLELAIVSAQPRECLVAWEFSDHHDGFLWNFRGKTGAMVKLPDALTVPKLGWRLDETIRKCRDRIVSKHLLHHVKNYAYSNVGDPIFIDTATKAFARARDASGLTWPDDVEPPTLHEVRSLSLRLYRDAYGRDFAQSLAAHKEGETTDIYTDVRGTEWTEVKIK